MATEADRIIEALRAESDLLAVRVAGLDDADLARGSGAAAWPVSRVLSHLGSGAEINRARLTAARAGTASDLDAHQVWQRWDTMSPREQAEQALRADAELIAAFEDLDATARADLRIDLGFLPQPVDVAAYAAMRLSEQALHGWDVAVALDPGATVPEQSAALLVAGGPVPLRMYAKAERLGGRHGLLRVETTDPGEVFGLALGETVDRVTLVDDADGELTLPAESWVRLTAGRLDAAHTPAAVRMSGPWTLDDLRATFPGY